MNEITVPALRYHGAKFRLAPWIMSHFPPHTCYVEPFGGAAGVLLRKPRSYAEVYNDLDGDIAAYFRVLRDPESRRRLIEAVALTPYHRDEFDLSWEEGGDEVERARRIAIRGQMGFGSAGATKGVTGFRIDTKRAYGTAQHAWAEFPAAIAAAGERFVGVLIENRDAIEVMQQHDAPDTLHYVDPPYVKSTRKGAWGRNAYRCELTDEQHVELISALEQLRGMVVLSGYPSGLYAEQLRGWQEFRTKARISAGRGTVLRTECVWINKACAAALSHSGYGLFAAHQVSA